MIIRMEDECIVECKRKAFFSKGAVGGREPELIKWSSIKRVKGRKQAANPRAGSLSLDFILVSSPLKQNPELTSSTHSSFSCFFLFQPILSLFYEQIFNYLSCFFFFNYLIISPTSQ